ncbi:MAG: hypothetical protein AB1656_18905 [Candidatus Omnitrophota bacterium]
MNALLSAILSDPQPELQWIAASALGLSCIFILYAYLHRRNEKNFPSNKPRNPAKAMITPSHLREEERQLLKYYSQPRRVKREAYYQYLNRNARLF